MAARLSHCGVLSGEVSSDKVSVGTPSPSANKAINESDTSGSLPVPPSPLLAAVAPPGLNRPSRSPGRRPQAGEHLGGGVAELGGHERSALVGEESGEPGRRDVQTRPAL